MNPGPWHQCGDRSQLLAAEQLTLGAGVGVVISPRDLSRSRALVCANVYRGLGADVLIDPQFHIPDFSNTHLSTYPLSELRVRVSQLGQTGSTEIDRMSNHLEHDGRDMQVAAVIAPAIVYEAGVGQTMDLNARLFAAAKRAGDVLGVPTLATVFLGRSLALSPEHAIAALGSVTALPADGWYFGFEFGPERLPSGVDSIKTLMVAGLTLAATGRPILHAFAGPGLLLSCAFGATGVGIGHSQNLWHFTRTRWVKGDGQGGGGAAPARFFSRTLWGTIIYPDEVLRLPRSLQREVMQSLSPFSPTSLHTTWDRWAAGKHLVHILCQEASHMVSMSTPRAAAEHAMRLLESAVGFHSAIEQQGIRLGDRTSAYQANWLTALREVLSQHTEDYEYLGLLAMSR